jgi:phage terminase large subunit-like protein
MDANAVALLSDPLFLEAVEGDDELSQWYEQYLAATGGYFAFTPRPDRPEIFDEQSSFCYDRAPVAFMIGGNGAGTSEAAAYKTALFVLSQQPPPRKNTPFWICSDTYEQVMEACWAEKLLGHGHIPPSEIQWDRVSWHNQKAGHPKRVPLKPWPDERGGNKNRNWVLEFKSYDQGRNAFQARSIGGFWFSEQFPVDIFHETLRGCREYMFNGGQFSEFTPIEPDLCVWIEHLLENTPPGWKFYRANTEANKPNLADGWFENFFAAVPDEMRETRMTGALATFEGAIYTTYSPSVHVVDDSAMQFPFPLNCTHYRAIDWGASVEHPFVCLWGYVDGAGDWWIYDEYWSVDQSRVTEDHVREIYERSLAWGWPERGNVHPCFRETFADPSRPDNIEEFGQRGIFVTPASNNVYQGIDYVRSLLKVNPASGKPRLHIHRRCRHLTEEMRKYRWKRGRKPTSGVILNPEVARPVPLKRDDDCCDAVRYLVFSEARGRGAAPTSTDYRDRTKTRRSIPFHPRSRAE